MKKIFMFLLLFIYILPFCVMAEITESTIVSTSSTIDEFEVNRIVISNVGYTRYSNMLSSGRAGLSVTGSVYNDYVRDVNLNVTLKLYDKDENVIDEIEEVVAILSKDKATYKVSIYEDTVDYSLDDVKYFSLSADISSDVAILDEGANDSYYLENYNVVVNVNYDNVYNVSKSFLATFKTNVGTVQSGIPFRLKYVRDDGTKVNRRAVISNIKVDDYYTLDTINGIRVISIGEEDKANTKKNIELSYNYNVGEDILDGNDEFIFYLIDSYNVKVDGISFEITMPKDFDESTIKFIDGDGVEVEDVTYTVNGNTITGNIDGVINPEASYAISLLLNDGYFVECTNNISATTIASITIPVIFVIISVLIWILIRNGSKNKNYKYSFYFNKNLNSLELGYLFNGKVKDNDIASLIFCLANKGYVEIVKQRKGYKVCKKKEYDGNDRVERTFMNELFSEKDEIGKREMMISLPKMKLIIDNDLNNKNRKKKVYFDSIFNYKLIFWLMIIVIFVVNTVDVLLEYQPSVIWINIVFCGIGYLILLKGLFSRNKIIEKILYLLVSLIFIISPIVLSSYNAFLQDRLYLIAYIIGMLCMMVIASICYSLPTRTAYGRKMLNKINAYKNYLINVDSNKIKEELNNNKNLLYDVLPYAFVLGISDSWVDKFSEKNIKGPKWYINNKFDLDEFYDDVKVIYSDIFIALKNSGSKQ